jgi:hypothetical protein
MAAINASEVTLFIRYYFMAYKLIKELPYLFELNMLMFQIRNKIHLAALLLILFVSTAWLMHEFYVSITEVRYNSDTERFEVSMRIFPDDLDRALLARTGIHTRLATELEHKSADSLLMLYLLEDFSLEVNGAELELTYLGKEPESNAIWCYLESSKIPDPGVLGIRNAILTEYFPDQVNIIQVYQGKWNKGLMLDRDQISGKLTVGE